MDNKTSSRKKYVHTQILNKINYYVRLNFNNYNNSKIKIMQKPQLTTLVHSLFIIKKSEIKAEDMTPSKNYKCRPIMAFVH